MPESPLQKYPHDGERTTASLLHPGLRAHAPVAWPCPFAGPALARVESAPASRATRPVRRHPTSWTRRHLDTGDSGRRFRQPSRTCRRVAHSPVAPRRAQAIEAVSCRPPQAEPTIAQAAAVPALACLSGTAVRLWQTQWQHADAPFSGERIARVFRRRASRPCDFARTPGKSPPATPRPAGCRTPRPARTLERRSPRRIRARH